MIDRVIKRFLELKDKTAGFDIKDKIFFFRELGYLISGGVSIVDAINLIKDNTSNISIQHICDSIYDSLKRGEPLYRALTRLEKHFNEGDINIIKSGENSGELINVLRYLAEEYEFIYDVRNKYIGAMIYPVLVFLVSIGALFIIFKYILPGILSILDQFEGVELPWTTTMLIKITSFVTNYSSDILVAFFIFMFGFFVFISTSEGRKAFDKLMLRIPIFGNITKMYFLIKYLRYKKLLINSGMNFMDVFRLLRGVIANTIYDEMIYDIMFSLKKGERIMDVLRKYPIIIPSDVVALLTVGEETASLPASIENCIWLYEQEFNKILNNLSKIIEPVLVIFVGCIVGFIAFSVFGIIGNIMDSLKM